MPFSLCGGYRYMSSSTGGHQNLWSIGLKIYIGDVANEALVAHDSLGATPDPYMPMKSVLGF